MELEYAIELYDAEGAQRRRWDAYPTKALAMKAAKDSVRDSPDGWSAGIFKRTSPAGAIGATWEEVENFGPLT